MPRATSRLQGRRFMSASNPFCRPWLRASQPVPRLSLLRHLAVLARRGRHHPRTYPGRPKLSDPLGATVGFFVSAAGSRQSLNAPSNLRVVT